MIMVMIMPTSMLRTMLTMAAIPTSFVTRLKVSKEDFFNDWRVWLHSPLLIFSHKPRRKISKTVLIRTPTTSIGAQLPLDMMTPDWHATLTTVVNGITEFLTWHDIQNACRQYGEWSDIASWVFPALSVRIHQNIGFHFPPEHKHEKHNLSPETSA